MALRVLTESAFQENAHRNCVVSPAFSLNGPAEIVPRMLPYSLR